VIVAEDACAELDAARSAACRVEWDRAGVAVASVADVIGGGASTTPQTPGRPTAPEPSRS
jgi:hypothetical protein